MFDLVCYVAPSYLRCSVVCLDQFKLSSSRLGGLLNEIRVQAFVIFVTE